MDNTALSVSSYYRAAIGRAFHAALEWMLGQGILLTLLLAVALLISASAFAVFRAWCRYHSWNNAVRDTKRAGGDFFGAGLGVLCLALLILFVIFFAKDAPAQLNKAIETITELRGTISDLNHRLAAAAQVFFSFSDQDDAKAGEDHIQVSFTITNNSLHAVQVLELAIARIAGEDQSPSLSLAQPAWCTEVTLSPREARIPTQTLPGIVSFQLPDNIPATTYYQYLNKEKVMIDGTDRPSEASFVDAGKSNIFTMEFTGVKLDRTITNVVMLCPVVVFVDDKGNRSAIVCYGMAHIVYTNPTRVVDNTDVSRHLLSSENVDSGCKRFHIP
jgi:hypothetical protein